MQITITGLRGEGKTTVAIAIAQTLRHLGANVQCIATTRRSEQEIMRLIRSDYFAPKLDHLNVSLVDVDVTEPAYRPRS